MPYTIKTSVVKYRKDADHDYVGIDGFDASLIDDESTGDPRKSWSTQKLKQEFDLKADLALKGAPEGLAELDASGKVPAIQLPSYVDDVLEGYVNPSENPNYTHFYKKRTAQSGGTYGYSDPYTPETGKIYVDLPTGKCYRWGGSVYAEVSNNDASVIAIERNNLVFTATRADGTTFTFTQQDMDTKNTAGTIENLDKKMYLVGAESQATSPQTRSNSKCFIGTNNKLYSDSKEVVTADRTVNGHALSSNVTVTKADIGLGNCDNTSDADKPVSTASQAALDLKVDKTIKVNGHGLDADVTVTKGDVGLGNCDNTSDVDKPVSIAQQAALDLKAPKENPVFTGTLTIGSTTITESQLQQLLAMLT